MTLVRPWIALGVVGMAAALPADAQVPALGMDSSYGCTVCHAEHRRAFFTGVHAERGIRCHDCHGGNPTALERPAAHTGRFLGHPTKRQIATLCASCHSDPDRMRQYGLPTGQLAELHTSRHGQLLERGNPDAPTCTDCHESHLIRRTTDARSNTHPLNIPVLCARCHTDRTLMGKYGLRTNEFAEFAASAHGVALFQQENFAAPTCVGCHGSHSALPPGLTQVTDVCGHCHTLVRDAFARGPHGPVAARGAMQGCLACHGNHATVVVPSDSLAETCTRCHAAGTAQATLGVQLEERLVRAEGELHEAEAAIASLVRAGRDVVDARLRLRTARTAYLQIAQVEHSLDLDALDDLGLVVATATQAIGAAEESALEQRWEHKLLLVPVWFLALAVVVLAWFRLSEAQRPAGPEGRSR
ncbi:MAG: cytochrome c3 family protein [Gemmatimonadota bacterium]|nr:cytochrome c3 family protein [Gemmatimonadota bacterium]